MVSELPEELLEQAKFLLTLPPNQANLRRALAGLFLGPSFVFVQRPLEQCLDYRLAADIQAGRPLIECAQHALSQVHIDPMNGSDHGEPISEVSGYVFA